MIGLLPWSKAAGAIEAIEASGGPAELAVAREALTSLADRQSIPGVKKKLAEFEERFIPLRDRIFDSLLVGGDLAAATEVHVKYPRASTRHEERIRLAAAAIAAGEEPPSLADISGAEIKWELRSAFFDARARESEKSGDFSVMLEMLSVWIQHASDDLAPHVRMTRHFVLSGKLEPALGHLQSAPASVQDALAKALLFDESLPGTSRAWLAIQTGRSTEALGILDSILLATPEDEWSISERVRFAEAAHDWARAADLYERWSRIRPGESAYVRRLSDILLAMGDRVESRKRLHEAWQYGDASAGLAFVARMIEEYDDPVEIEVFLDQVALGALTSSQLVEVASHYFSMESTEKAATALNKAFKMDRLIADTVIGKANAYVHHSMVKRLPILELLIVIGPVRGFPADPYRLMMAEDLIAEGRSREARPHLEDLVLTPLRWKSLVALSQMVMSEPKAAQEQMLERIEATLPEAEKIGRNIWVEIIYTAAVLAESAGRKESAVTHLEKLIAREFEYLDATMRLQKLKETLSA